MSLPALVGGRGDRRPAPLASPTLWEWFAEPEGGLFPFQMQ